MNILELKMLDILKDLKSKNNSVCVKVDFEAEGTRIFELTSLLKILFKSGVLLTIKIGGCEAVLDLDLAKSFGADEVVVPMVESAFSLQKFKHCAKKIYKNEIDSVNWIANVETKCCCENIDEILKMGRGFLSGVTIGRVDLSGSLGLSRKDIDGEAVFDRCYFLAKKAASSGFFVGLGGGVVENSFYIIKKLKDFLKRVETRKLIFDFEDDFNSFKHNILKATEFELLYLKNKSNSYLALSKEDEARIKLLNDRI